MCNRFTSVSAVLCIHHTDDTGNKITCRVAVFVVPHHILGLQGGNIWAAVMGVKLKFPGQQ